MRLASAVSRSAELLNHNGHTAIDATFFDRGHASRHYAHRSERSIQTLTATLLVDTVHNARIDDALYGQCWMSETVFSAIKRTNCDPVRARTWYCEFRGIILKAAVHNVEQAVK